MEYSVEFHGTICHLNGSTLVPWNCDIWYGDSRVPKTAIGNAMDSQRNLVSFKLAIIKFYGIQWNLVTCCFTTQGFTEYSTKIQWNLLSMKMVFPKFNRIPWNSMIFLTVLKFYGIFRRGWCHSKFHGTIMVPWNSTELLNWVQRFYGVSWNLVIETSSMERSKFHRIPWKFCSGCGNFVEFHGIRCWRQAPWNF